MGTRPRQPTALSVACRATLLATDKEAGGWWRQRTQPSEQACSIGRRLSPEVRGECAHRRPWDVRHHRRGKLLSVSGETIRRGRGNCASGDFGSVRPPEGERINNSSFWTADRVPCWLPRVNITPVCSTLYHSLSLTQKPDRPGPTPCLRVCTPFLHAQDACSPSSSARARPHAPALGRTASTAAPSHTTNIASSCSHQHLSWMVGLGMLGATSW